MSASPSSLRGHELFQLRHAFDGAAAPTLFRSSEKADPVTRRALGLKVAGGVRMDVFVRARPLSPEEAADADAAVLEVHEKKKQVVLR